MQKKKRNNIEKLRMILDKPSSKKLHPEEEKHLKALSKRLKGSSRERSMYIERGVEKEDEGEVDLLKARVTIHQREEKKVFGGFKVKDTRPGEKEALYDVEKVEVEGPEFIEVKPKKIEDKVAVEKEEKLPEWQPVDVKKTEVVTEEKKVKEEKPEAKEELFLPVEEKKEEIKTEEEFKLEEKVVEEQIKTKEEKKKPRVKEKREKKLEDLERKNKIEVFKDIKSIDEDTAVLLYDHGFMTIEDLRDISAKDLSHIKGIKRKVAKKIKKEISSKFVEAPIISNGEKPSVKKEEDVFKDMGSIDQETAKLLYENGITSIEILEDTPIKQLTKIKGIKRKLAKKIKKELKAISKKAEENGDRLSSEQVVGEWKIEDTDEKPSKKSLKENPLIEEVEEEWDSFYDEDKAAEKEPEEPKGYMHKDYTLYEKQIKSGKGKKRVVHFFSKAEPDDGEPIDLPPGFEVKINKKTGVPYLKKKKK